MHKIDVSPETDRLTVKILQGAREKKALTWKDLRVIAAEALYIACKANDERSTQMEIAEVAESTEVTLRNRLKDLKMVVHPREILEDIFAQRGI